MNIKKTFLLLAFGFAASVVQGQTVDEILKNYFENMGGLDKMKAVKGVKMQAKVNQQGMEIPLEIVQLRDGRQYTKITFQGMTLMQGVFDGETLWNTNFQSMKAEKADAESTANFKLEANDFMDPFIDYKSKNYTVELIGKETIEGAEAFKVKLVKEPKTINGVKKEDISYYFFDKENYVPIAVESEISEGPMAGNIGRTTFSDYQEVDGIYFAFSMTQGLKDSPGQPITMQSIELNPTVDETVFKYTE